MLYESRWLNGGTMLIAEAEKPHSRAKEWWYLPHYSTYAIITLFGDVAVTLNKLMGHSGTVPSALLA